MLLLGPRTGRYREGRLVAFMPSSIPFLALWLVILIVGWFGFNVMSAQTLQGVSGLVAVNSLMAMVGGTMAALIVGRNDPGFLHNGPLAGLHYRQAGSDLMHPVGALVTGPLPAPCLSGVLLRRRTNGKSMTCSVSGHCMAQAWGGIALWTFGQTALGGLGGQPISQLIGTALRTVIALLGGLRWYTA